MSLGDLQSVKDIRAERLTLKDLLFRQVDRIGSIAPNILKSGNELDRNMVYALHFSIEVLHAMIKPRASKEYIEKYTSGPNKRLPVELGINGLYSMQLDADERLKFYVRLFEWFEDAIAEGRYLGLYASKSGTIICENAGEIIEDNPRLVKEYVLEQLNKNPKWLTRQDEETKEAEDVETVRAGQEEVV